MSEPYNEQFDFDLGPEKIFADRAHMRVLNGMMNMAFESGDYVSTYVLSLPLAKQISRALALQIEEIEKKNGIIIDGRLSTEPMPSPIKPGDVKGEGK